MDASPFNESISVLILMQASVLIACVATPYPPLPFIADCRNTPVVIYKELAVLLYRALAFCKAITHGYLHAARRPAACALDVQYGLVLIALKQMAHFIPELPTE